MQDQVTNLKVDVGILKTQVTTICQLCEKIDLVIDKIVNNQDKYISQIYNDMEKRQNEKNEELKEVHKRIDTVIDKVQLTEHRIMDEIKELRAEMGQKFKQEQDAVEKLSNWRWMIAGGIIVIAWLISHVDYDTIEKILK
jgi:hypothetical protein